MYRQSPLSIAQIVAASAALMVLASDATAQRVVDEATLVDANGKQIGTLHADSRRESGTVFRAIGCKAPFARTLTHFTEGAAEQPLHTQQ